jgi:hypothetical protein
MNRRDFTYDALFEESQVLLKKARELEANKAATAEDLSNARALVDHFAMLRKLEVFKGQATPEKTGVAATMTAWTCAYCGSTNAAGALHCSGCQAPRRTETRRAETLYKGRPLSTLSDAEMDEAVEAFMGDTRHHYSWEMAHVDLPDAFVDALRRKMDELYKGPGN